MRGFLINMFIKRIFEGKSFTKAFICYKITSCEIRMGFYFFFFIIRAYIPFKKKEDIDPRIGYYDDPPVFKIKFISSYWCQYCGRRNPIWKKECKCQKVRNGAKEFLEKYKDDPVLDMTFKKSE